MNPIVITESVVEPITLAEAGQNLHAAEDGSGSYIEADRIERLIKTARQKCEETLDVSLVAKMLEIALDQFGTCPIELPRGPVRSIVSVTYVNSDGIDTVLAPDQYRLNGYASPETLLLAYNVSWPTARSDINSVRVRYAAGYPSDDSPPQEVPEPIRQSMHLYIAHYFRNREAVDVDGLMELPLGAQSLLSHYRRGLGV